MTTANPFGPRRSRPASPQRARPRAARHGLTFGLWRRRRGRQPARRCSDETQHRRSPSPATGDQQTSPADGTPIRITFGDTELTARLDDNATARDLAAQLPLTLTFRDHNNVEKTAPLPRELSLEGAPEGHDPAAGDIGYWAPDGDLVFYYDSDAPFFNGIVRIGEFDGEMDAIERQSQDFTVTIERG